MFLINLEKGRRLFDRVYVSSDSLEILRLAESHGAVPILRGQNLCGDTPDIPVFQDALRCMEDADGLVAIHVNNPTIDKNLIAMVKKCLEMGVPEVMTCHPMTHLDEYKLQHNKVYGSIRGMTRERLENYPDPYEPEPDVLLVDTSLEIETLSDYENALCQSQSQS